MLAALLENVSCPVCGSDRYQIIRAPCYPDETDTESLLRGYSSASDVRLMDRIVRCNECEMVFLSPRLRSDLILSSYAESPDHDHWPQRDLRVTTFRRSLSSLIKRLGLAPKEDFRILDIGSAGGYFCRAANDAGFTCIGIEPNKELAEKGRRHYGVDLRCGTLNDQAFSANSFSLVTLWDVLEHVPDPRGLLRQIGPLLTKGGYLAVNFPDYGSRIRKLMGFRWPFFLSVHLHYFTTTHLDRLLNESGYRTLYVAPHWQTLELGYVLKRASSSSSLISPFARVVNAVGLGHIPFSYYVGQTLLVAQKI